MSDDINPALYESVKNTVLNKISVRDGGARYDPLKEFIVKTTPNNPIVFRFNDNPKPTRDELINFIETMGLLKQHISKSSLKSQQSIAPLVLPPPRTTLTSTDVLKDIKISLPKLQETITLPSRQLSKPLLHRPLIIKPSKNIIKSVKGINDYIKFLYNDTYHFSMKDCGGGGDCFYHVIRYILSENKSIFSNANENLINFYKIKNDKKSQIQFLRKLTCNHVDNMSIIELYAYVSNNREKQMSEHKKTIINSLITVMKEVLKLYKVDFIENNDDIHLKYIDIERDLRHINISLKDKSAPEFKNVFALIKSKLKEFKILSSDDNDEIIEKYKELIQNLRDRRIVLENADDVFISKEYVKEALMSDMYATHFDASIIAEMLQLKLIIFPSDAKIIVSENIQKEQSTEIVQETCINKDKGLITVIIYNISLSHFQLGILNNKVTGENIYMFETGTRPDIEQILCKNKINLL